MPQSLQEAIFEDYSSRCPPTRSATTTTPLLRTTKSSLCDENRLLGTNNRMLKKDFSLFLTSFDREWGTLQGKTI